MRYKTPQGYRRELRISRRSKATHGHHTSPDIRSRTRQTGFRKELGKTGRLSLPRFTEVLKANGTARIRGARKTRSSLMTIYTILRSPRVPRLRDNETKDYATHREASRILLSFLREGQILRAVVARPSIHTYRLPTVTFATTSHPRLLNIGFSRIVP